MKSLWALSRSALERRDAGLSWRDQLSVMRRVMPLLWPQGSAALKLRVIAAFSLIVVGSLPVLLIYPFAQRYFVRGMLIGSIKG